MALAWGEEIRVPLGVGRAALASYLQAVEADREALDWSAMYPFTRELAGLDWPGDRSVGARSAKRPPDTG